MNIAYSSSAHDSISINLLPGSQPYDSQHDSQQDDSQQHNSGQDSQQHDSPMDSSAPQNNSLTPGKKIQYINVPDCPVPPVMRHSNVPMEDCPAYKKRSKTCITKNYSNEDYDDVQSTVNANLKMHRNPAYRHNTFTYV